MNNELNDKPAKLIGRPHYELIHRYGCRESLISRHATEAEAKQALRNDCGHDLGALKIRYREF